MHDSYLRVSLRFSLGGGGGHKNCYSILKLYLYLKIRNNLIPAYFLLIGDNVVMLQPKNEEELIVPYSQSGVLVKEAE